MVLPETVDGDVGKRHHQDERELENIHQQSDGMVKREAHGPAVIPDGDAQICQEIFQVVEKDLLPPHAHGVAEHILGVDERHHRQSDRDEVVDQHEMDGQPGFAEPLGSLTFVRG